MAESAPLHRGRWLRRVLDGMVHALSRRKVSFLTVCPAVFVLTVAAGRFLPKVYRSSAVVSISPAAIGLPASPQDALEALRVEISDRGFLSGVIEGEPDLRRLLDGQGSREGRLERMCRAVHIEPQGEGRYEIAYLDSEAVVAQVAANAIAARLVAAVCDKRLARYEKMLEPLEQQRRSLQEALKEKERQISAFRSLNRVYLLPERSVQQQEAELRQLAERIERERPQLEILQAKLAGTPKTIERERSTEHEPSYDLFRSELSVLELRRERLLRRYTEKHPSVKEVSEQIEEYQHRLAVLDGGVTMNVVESINPVYQLLQQRQAEQELLVEQLEARLDSERQALAELRQKSGEAARAREEDRRLSQEYSRLQKDHEAVLAQMGFLEEEWKAAVVQEPIRVLARASLPGRPTRDGFGLGIAGGLAIILGLVAVFLREGLDRTLRSVEQARRALNLPVLGAIPVIGPKEE